jgi:hydroxyacylglutathione hydrolase
MDVLMRLRSDTPVRPGHTDPTTIGEGWERNPFIRARRGLDSSREARCTPLGLPATLLLSARDYDGGTKCWVRFDEGNRLDVVPGSRVEVVER